MIVVYNDKEALARALSLYIFLRAMSQTMKLCPFEVEAYLLSLVQTDVSVNPLLSEIHITLLKSLCTASPKLHPTVNIELMNYLTWITYIPHIIGEFETQISFSNRADAFGKIILIQVDKVKHLFSTFSCSDDYFHLSMNKKLDILEALIYFVMTKDSFLRICEHNVASRPTNIADTIPGLVKGEDGYPEMCTLCGVEGNLICCDYCPCTYHEACLLENPQVWKSGKWRCYECSIRDSTLGACRIRWLQLDPTDPSQGVYTIIGRYILKMNTCFKYSLLSIPEVIELFTNASSRGRGVALSSQFPWIHYLNDWKKVFPNDAITDNQLCNDNSIVPKTKDSRRMPRETKFDNLNGDNISKLTNSKNREAEMEQEDYLELLLKTKFDSIEATIGYLDKLQTYLCKNDSLLLLIDLDRVENTSVHTAMETMQNILKRSNVGVTFVESLDPFAYTNRYNNENSHHLFSSNHVPYPVKCNQSIGTEFSSSPSSFFRAAIHSTCTHLSRRNWAIEVITKRALEILYEYAGCSAFLGSETTVLDRLLWSRIWKRESWYLSLFMSKSPENMSQLFLKLLLSIHPVYFSPKLFLTLEEIDLFKDMDSSNSSRSSASLHSTNNKDSLAQLQTAKWRRRMKANFIRVHTFAKLSGHFEDDEDLLEVVEGLQPNANLQSADTKEDTDAIEINYYDDMAVTMGKRSRSQISKTANKVDYLSLSYQYRRPNQSKSVVTDSISNGKHHDESGASHSSAAFKVEKMTTENNSCCQDASPKKSPRKSVSSNPESMNSKQKIDIINPNDGDDEVQGGDEYRFAAGDIERLQMFADDECKVFCAGRRVMRKLERAFTPSCQLRRLARCGGVAFLPNHMYFISTPNTIAEAPYYSILAQQIKEAKGYCDIALIMSELESFLRKFPTSEIVSDNHHISLSQLNGSIITETKSQSLLPSIVAPEKVRLKHFSYRIQSCIDLESASTIRSLVADTYDSKSMTRRDVEIHRVIQRSYRSASNLLSWPRDCRDLVSKVTFTYNQLSMPSKDEPVVDQLSSIEITQPLVQAPVQLLNDFCRGRWVESLLSSSDSYASDDLTPVDHHFELKELINTISSGHSGASTVPPDDYFKIVLEKFISYYKCVLATAAVIESANDVNNEVMIVKTVLEASTVARDETLQILVALASQIIHTLDASEYHFSHNLLSRDNIVKINEPLHSHIKTHNSKKRASRKSKSHKKILGVVSWHQRFHGAASSFGIPHVDNNYFATAIPTDLVKVIATYIASESINYIIHGCIYLAQRTSHRDNQHDTENLTMNAEQKHKRRDLGPSSRNAVTFETYHDCVVSVVGSVEPPLNSRSLLALRQLFGVFEKQSTVRSRGKNVAARTQSPLELQVWQRVVTLQESQSTDRTIVMSTAPSTVQSTTYIPQVGDNVIYYLQGHREYLTDFPDLRNHHDRDHETDGTLTGTKKKGDRRGLLSKKLEIDYVLCRILTIDYEFPHRIASVFNGKKIFKDSHQVDNGILMVIQLGPLLLPRRKNSNLNEENDNGSGQSLVHLKSFYVLYRPGHTCADFLVPFRTIIHTLLNQWAVGMHIVMFFDGGNKYEGTIVSINRDNEDRDIPVPTWQAVQIYWKDSNDYSQVNEWELEMPLTTRVGESVSDRRARLERHNNPILCEAGAWERRLRYVNDRISGILKDYLKDEQYSAFVNAITDAEAPGYSQLTPFCMTLTLMRDRATNLYYRQPAAALGDARILYINCAYYNIETSAIAVKAAELYRDIRSRLVTAFPEEDFSDFSQFDACLGSRIPARLLALTTKSPFLRPIGNH